MRKGLASIISTIYFIIQFNTIGVFAIGRDSTEIINNAKGEKEISNKGDVSNEIQREKYEVIKKNILINYSNDEEVKEEVKKDLSALDNIEYLIPKTNEKYEIIEVHNDGEYSYLDKSSELDKAINIANNSEGKLKIEEKSTIAVINNKGQIIYSPIAIGRIIKHVSGAPYPSKNKNTNLYTDSDLKNEYTYINHGYVDDVPIIEDKGNVAKIQVSSFKGWINKDTDDEEFDMIVVPINQVKNPSYYKNVNGDLVHFISSDITSESEIGHSINIGKAPKFMLQGIKYYSYDGNYFYKELSDVILDLKESQTKRAVNYRNEFYQYYLNLPFRSRGVFTALELDTFINANTENNSKLRNIGQALINAEKRYGVNSIIMLSVAINESNWGKSSIAQNKNNIFGINALDSNPTGTANEFKSVEDCINEFAKNYISKGYANPGSWKYKGAHLGNKNLGANVKYASDPFWGEKAAAYMYRIDKNISVSGSLREYNSKILGIHQKESSIKDENGKILYEIKEKDEIKTGRVGTMIIINNDFNDNLYSVNSHVTVPVAIGTFNGEYDWDKKGVIDKKDLKIINGSIHEMKKGVNYSTYVEGIGWQENKSNGELSGTVGLLKKIEGIKITINSIENLSIRYRVHIEDFGWQEWKSNGEIAGMPGEGKRIEAIEIETNGDNRYSVEYRSHIQDIGWQENKSNGELSGTTGESKRMEGIEIRLIERINLSNIRYQTHIEDEGWHSEKYEGELSGTTGKGKRLEAIKISVDGLESIDGLKYRTHIQDYGWQSWKVNGEVSGTTGESRRIEAIEIKLNDEYKKYYDIEYRAHIQDIGWQEWRRNGEMAGTTGESKRLEAIEIRLIEK